MHASSIDDCCRVFVAIFMLPKGIDQERYTHNLQNDPMFVLVVASNSYAFASSLTSQFFFISIITSYSTEENFLRKLLLFFINKIRKKKQLINELETYSP